MLRLCLDVFEDDWRWKPIGDHCANLLRDEVIRCLMCRLKFIRRDMRETSLLLVVWAHASPSTQLARGETRAGQCARWFGLLAWTGHRSHALLQWREDADAVWNLTNEMVLVGAGRRLQERWDPDRPHQPEVLGCSPVEGTSLCERTPVITPLKHA